MSRNVADAVASPSHSHHIDQNTGSRNKGNHTSTSRRRQADSNPQDRSAGHSLVIRSLSRSRGSNDKVRLSRDSKQRDLTPAQHSVLGKRRLDSRERTPVNRAKRHRGPTFSPPVVKLCDDCAAICWDQIERIAKEKLRFTWKGRPVVDVGRRYRKPPVNDCTLCHQLHAPWIEDFLESRRWIEGKVIPDIGDRIHVFPNLQYVHHISNFQSGRNVLKLHEAPFHISVVPISPRWKEGLLEHLAKRGMVVVLPDGRPESKILQPQQLPPKFDPKLVRSWLKTCEQHRSRCKPKEPDVKGMRVIDCSFEPPRIRDYEPGDEYVALSYVWGPSPSTGPVEARDRAPGTKRILRLPRDVPLTIRDAIKVTKALKYKCLWVDKYCIDQHNPVEQQDQFSRMGDIYAGSQLAIFALGDDSSAGLPGVSSQPRLGQQECRSGAFRFISTMPDPHELIKWSKWSTRAWTYQEGLFSTRRLFFTNHQLYFECNAMNCAETFKSNLNIIHTNNGQRFRAYYRAGQFVCGNSTPYSHLDVRRNEASHRKVDMLRRCQHQITQYTRRELTNKDDVLHAFAAIARFYAKTTAMIACLSGLPIPFPIANISTMQEGLDHLTYALAWSHEIDNFDKAFPRRYHRKQAPHSSSSTTRWTQSRWTPLNPKPQRRPKFPSWSWAGWFGQVRPPSPDNLPYCFTSLLSAVQIGFPNNTLKPYDYIHGFERYKTYFIRDLLTAETLHLDAYVLDPVEMAARLHHEESAQVRLSVGPSTLGEFRTKLSRGEYTCLVLGTYGEPRRDVYRAIQSRDKKRAGAQKRRIDLFERHEVDAILCLVVRTDLATGYSYRKGLVRCRYYTRGGEDALREWNRGVGERRSFVLK